MRKKIRLTKKRLSSLDVALSFDDILYAKFEALNNDLHRRAERLIHNKKRLWRVGRLWKDGTMELMQVIDVQETPDGMLVLIR